MTGKKMRGELRVVYAIDHRPQATGPATIEGCNHTISTQAIRERDRVKRLRLGRLLDRHHILGPILWPLRSPAR